MQKGENVPYESAIYEFSSKLFVFSPLSFFVPCFLSVHFFLAFVSFFFASCLHLSSSILFYSSVSICEIMNAWSYTSTSHVPFFKNLLPTLI